MNSATARHQHPVGVETLMVAKDVSKYYGDGKTNILVLDNISLELRAGEFVALLGPSGSGKSTLLRTLAGLIPASAGEVLVDGIPLRGANPQVAIVFQSFALFPWLTVLQNVELGLLAKAMPSTEKRERALRAIDLIGLDGFENAFPKELSGGMKQRVGFARALVVEPEMLFLDEPFSALDVLTAENLRHELQDLWLQRKIPTRAILLVTHNIDEAVSMADRLLVLAADPGHIRVELPGLPLDERRSKGARHTQLVDTVYRIMVNPQEDVAKLLPGVRPVQAPLIERPYQTLPHVSIGDLIGFIERLQALKGQADLYQLARDLNMEADDLLPLTEAADMLGFADIQEGDAFLTEAGRRLAEAGVLEEKEIFRHQALSGIELLRRIMRELQANPEHRISEERILTDLERTFSPDEARKQLDTAIDWGRYAELFGYHDATGEFFLEEGEPVG